MSAPDVIPLEGAEPSPRCGCGELLEWVDCLLCVETPHDPCTGCGGAEGRFVCAACDADDEMAYCRVCGCYLAGGMIERDVVDPTLCVECADPVEEDS